MIKKIILFLLMSFLSVKAHSQNTKVKPDTAKRAYGNSYKKPEFIGGSLQLYEYLRKNIHYPDIARESDIEGKVIVRFMVDKAGTISHLQLVRHIGGGCDEEAIRVVKNMPDWQPATYKHKPTKAMVSLPVIFKLE